MPKISLEAARVNAGLTQPEAAKELGITVQTLINWEKGRTEPTVSQSRLIERVYDFPFDHIFMPEKSNVI